MSYVTNPVHLILGEDEFLTERARRSIIDEVQKDDTTGMGIPVARFRAVGATPGELSEALSPSLFSEDRIVVVSELADSSKDIAELVLSVAESPAPGITLIIEHSGKGRQKAMAGKLQKIAQTHSAAALKANERPDFVKAEFRRFGVQATPDVIRAVLESLGSDLREVASAVSQLVADTDGKVDIHAVREYYQGVAEVSGFDVADLACSGQTEKALATARRALQLGVPPVVLTSALEMGVAAIARLHGRPGRIRGVELAREVGMPPWKVEKTAQVARRWSADAVSKATIIVAELDMAVKGQSGSNPEYAYENAVREISLLARGS